MSYGFETLFLASATVFGAISLRALLSLPWCRRLPSDLPKEKPGLVSIIFAARDEETRVEQTLRHLFGQQHVEFEVIAVDDRSRDRTGQILKSMSAEDPRLHPKRVDVLPPGWLGKCHACEVGATSARGEWLLFTDADCWLKPDTLARALAVAEREEADHVTLTPGVAPETSMAKAWHLGFIMTAADWIARVNRDNPKGYLGIGAFNLVRAETYRKSGGHQALRLTVVEDVKLGKLIRRAGGRTRAFIGGDDVQCHWGVTVRQMTRIMEKNYFAAIDYKTTVAFSISIGGCLCWCAALVGPFTGLWSGLVAGAALGSLMIPALIIARRLNWSMSGPLLAPFVFVALFYAVLRSTFITLKQGGIRWRDTFYPLDTLRAGNLS